jgi:hypothetical protein
MGRERSSERVSLRTPEGRLVRIVVLFTGMSPVWAKENVAFGKLRHIRPAGIQHGEQ